MKPFLLVGLLAMVALSGCAKDQDSDLDGLFDSIEREGWTVVTHTTSQQLNYVAKPDPNVRDTDGDGLSDFAEFRQIPPTDPTNPDTDGDGLTDCQEAAHTNRTECESASFNGPFDGGYPTEATFADSDPGRSILINDILGYKGPNGEPLEIERGDGISDYDEIMGYQITIDGRTEMITTNPLDADHDDDNLADGDELFLGGHPWQVDTDGDGCRDGADNDPSKATQFNFGLETLTLKRDFDSSGGADLVLYTALHGQVDHNRDQITKIGQGENDISSLDPGAIQIDCVENPTPFFPWDPTVQLRILLEDNDGDTFEVIQIQETQSPTLWSLRTNTFMRDGEVVGDNGLVTLDGPDATVQLRPFFS